MSKIYDQFDAAFSNVSAWAILRDGKHVGRVVVKFGASATAFVHFTGSEMAKGRAGGGGYHKETEAVREAIAKLQPLKADAKRGELITLAQREEIAEGPNGSTWSTILGRAGFELAAVI